MTHMTILGAGIVLYANGDTCTLLGMNPRNCHTLYEYVHTLRYKEG